MAGWRTGEWLPVAGLVAWSTLAHGLRGEPCGRRTQLRLFAESDHASSAAFAQCTVGRRRLEAAVVRVFAFPRSVLLPRRAERAAELGLEGASIDYDAEPPSRQALDGRLDRDLERGTTGLGPHLDEIRLGAGDRDLRTFGSQGEQRLAVLSLLLAEAELLSTHGAVPPLLLLDDALSELDADRRRLLSTRLGVSGQTLVTATGAEALPLAPAQLLVVSPGEVRAA